MPKLLLIALIALASSCGTPGPHRSSVSVIREGEPSEVEANRLANLKRAAQLPWVDSGRCAVQESPGDWATLIERCYDALDLSRIRFSDHQGICPIAQAGIISADQAVRLVGICLLVQPQLAVGAVIVIGVVVVAAAIAAEIEAAERAKKKKKKKKWCDCYCGKGSTPVLRNILDFECRAECVLRGHAPTDYSCR